MKKKYKLETGYGKKLGLPNYSSHNFYANIEVSGCDSPEEAERECEQLYDRLQAIVDRKLAQVGWLPEANTYGMLECGERDPAKEEWRCTPGQRLLIVNFVDEHHLDRNDVEKLAQKIFRTRVRFLNSIQAAEFIEHLVRAYPEPLQVVDGSKAA